jgi:hypothetical protein
LTVYYDIALNPGRLQQYGEMSRKTTEASVALYPRSYYLTQTPSVGATGVRVVGLVPSWSDLDTPFPGPAQRVLEHFGPEEGARINAMASEAIRETRISLHRVRPDLSYQPEP